jgi:DNA topoisomerase-3
MQTKTLQDAIAQVEGSVVSYGPCQFPTLGFVVQRYLQVKNFVSEPFWYIFLSLSRPSSSQGDNVETEFKWRRVHLFDHDAAAVIYEHVISNPIARVTKVVEKDTKKW